MTATADKLASIATRECRTVESVQLLLGRWCYPYLTTLAPALELALVNADDWRVWVDVIHPERVDLGYYDGEVRW